MSNQTLSRRIAAASNLHLVRKRVAIICDYAEERWASMDLVGEMLFEHLVREHSSVVEASYVRPRFARLLSRLPLLPRRMGFNADRLLNRVWRYPRVLRRCAGQFELFHIVDHSYAHLIRELPAERTVISCHDLDTFRCLLEPERDPRPVYFRAMAHRTLSALRRAATVVCDSRAIRDELLSHRLLPRERLVVVPNGVHPSCSPAPDRSADAEAARLLGPADAGAILILHVGSTVPRKRIDLLLRIFADLRRRTPNARLLQAGGSLTVQQQRLAAELGVESGVQVLPFLSRPLLAAIYRRAALVLVPSDREGFGLPVVEAMACRTPVVASDLPVLREVGGEASAYCPVGDIGAWSEMVGSLLRERADRPDLWEARRLAGARWAARFSWSEYTNRVLKLYEALLS